MFCRAEGLKVVCRSTQRGQKGRARRAKRICFQGRSTWEYPAFSVSWPPGASPSALFDEHVSGSHAPLHRLEDSASSPRRVSVRVVSIG